MESEAHGREKESLSENAEAAEDSQWVRPLEEVCVECCDAKLCCFASPIWGLANHLSTLLTSLVFEASPLFLLPR